MSRSIRRSSTLDLKRPPVSARRRARGGLALAAALLGGCVLLRLWYAGVRQLVPDEAFYWVLSRHLASGYLDHPPMIAYLIRLTTYLAGTNETGVRLPAIVLGFASAGIVAAIYHWLTKDRRGTLAMLALWMCSPLFIAISTIVTPDTPAIFFSLLGVVCAIRVARVEAKASNWKWAALGVCWGLALLSKYTTVLVPVATVGALLASARGRELLRGTGVWIAVVASLIVFYPVIAWNINHGWASFAFQLHHGLVGEPVTLGQRFGHVGEFVGGQLLLWTPVLFVIAALAVIRFWRRSLARELDLSWQILLWVGTLPLVFFLVASFFSRQEGNWPAFAYFPLSVILIRWVFEQPTQRAWDWTQIGIGVAAISSIVLQTPEMIWDAQRHLPNWVMPAKSRALPKKLNDVFGWRELGMAVGKQTQFNPFTQIVCNTHQDAAELSFYVPGRPDCWAVRLADPGEPLPRPTAYDYFENPPDLKHIPQVLLINGHTAAFCREYGMLPVSVTNWVMQLHGHLRDRSLTLLVRPGELPVIEEPIAPATQNTRIVAPGVRPTTHP